MLGSDQVFRVIAITLQHFGDQFKHIVFKSGCARFDREAFNKEKMWHDIDTNILKQPRIIVSSHEREVDNSLFVGHCSLICGHVVSFIVLMLDRIEGFDFPASIESITISGDGQRSVLVCDNISVLAMRFRIKEVPILRNLVPSSLDTALNKIHLSLDRIVKTASPL